MFVYLSPAVSPSFVVPLADLERGPHSATWPISEAWLARALEGTDATPDGEGRLEVTLTKSASEVLVRGQAHARVKMPDARSLEPVDVTLNPEVFLMLSPASTPEPGARLRQKRLRAEAGPRRGERAKPVEKRQRGWHDDPELQDGEVARDTYSGEEVVLDGFVREFILLELPMVVHKDLRSAPPPAIAPPPAAPSSEQQERVDPRLAPLAAIAERLRGRKD